MNCMPMSWMAKVPARPWGSLVAIYHAMSCSLMGIRMASPASMKVMVSGLCIQDGNPADDGVAFFCRARNISAALVAVLGFPRTWPRNTTMLSADDDRVRKSVSDGLSLSERQLLHQYFGGRFCVISSSQFGATTVNGIPNFCKGSSFRLGRWMRG